MASVVSLWNTIKLAWIRVCASVLKKKVAVKCVLLQENKFFDSKKTITWMHLNSTGWCWTEGKLIESELITSFFSSIHMVITAMYSIWMKSWEWKVSDASKWDETGQSAERGDGSIGWNLTSQEFVTIFDGFLIDAHCSRPKWSTLT